MGQKRLATVLLPLLLLAACAGSGGTTPQAMAADAPQPTAAAAAAPSPTPAAEPYQAPPLQLSPFHADEAEGTDGVLLDLSATEQGYLAACADTGDTARLKLQVVFGDSKYNYDLPNDGTPVSVPLQSGNGTYTFYVLQNTTGNKYATLYETSKTVDLLDEWQPFLRPSQMVSYTADSACVKKAAELARYAADDAEVVQRVYEYICQNIAYDSQKAKTVADGYLPDPDTTLAEGKGICYDYAALAAAMLRSQGIPTKLMTGYVEPGNLYHAWNMVWLENTGWVTVSLQAKADSWQRIDTTFAAGSDETYTGDGTAYTDRYTY